MTGSQLGLRLGIIGGLGPLASADFYRKLSELTPARTDTDHLPLVLLSLPQLPDRTEAILNGSDTVLNALVNAVSTLDQLGVERIAIPCNTAHHWFDALNRATRAKIVHIVDSVVEEMAQFPGARRVTLLATRGTLASGFYQSALLAAGHEIYVPRRQDFQNLVDAAIRDVKAGALADAATALNSALAGCREEGADVTILACTELSAISHRIDIAPSGIVDSNTALARTCLRQLGLLQDPTAYREVQALA